ncbi:hypothetical protein H4S07_004984, partial [Coemansia furcata]
PCCCSVWPTSVQKPKSCQPVPGQSTTPLRSSRLALSTPIGVEMLLVWNSRASVYLSTTLDITAITIRHF